MISAWRGAGFGLSSVRANLIGCSRTLAKPIPFEEEAVWYAVEIRVEDQWHEVWQLPLLSKALESACDLRRIGWDAAVTLDQVLEAHDRPVWDDPWWVDEGGEPLPEEDPEDAPCFVVLSEVAGA